MLGIFDSHAHYDDEQFDDDREELLEGMNQGGVEYIVNVGASLDTVKKTVEIIDKYRFIYGSAGVHPEETYELTVSDIDWLGDICHLDKIVAVGEIGLDYHSDEADRELQIKWFRRQLDIAVEQKLPVIIHSREAAKDTMDILKEYQTKLKDGNKGVIHCFSYTPELACEYINMGYNIGIGGVVTFNNSKKLKQVTETIPLERIVIETDCPYLAPVPNRGKRNSSLNLTYVVDEIASLKGITHDEVIEVTRNNAMKMYGIEV